MTRPLGHVVSLHSISNKHYCRTIMIYRTKLKIGEFSKMMQVTVKTLRLYEQKGLLQPDEVDEWTGYRYYNISQMQQLSTIRSLQGMGFSLAEIKEIFDNNSTVPPLEQLEQKIVDCQRQLHMLQGRLQLLLSLRDSRKEISTMEKFSIQTLPSIIVASHREVIKNWQALGPLCTDVIGPEMHRLGCRCPMPGYCFTVEHDKEYKPTDIDIEYSPPRPPSASRWRKWAPIVPLSSSNACQKCPQPCAWLTTAPTTVFTSPTPSFSATSKSMATASLASTALSMSMASGTRKTPKSGSPSFRCQ